MHINNEMDKALTENHFVSSQYSATSSKLFVSISALFTVAYEDTQNGKILVQIKQKAVENYRSRMSGNCETTGDQFNLRQSKKKWCWLEIGCSKFDVTNLK